MIRRPPRSTLFPHDALPISLDPGDVDVARIARLHRQLDRHECRQLIGVGEDRKSTRLNSSHSQISYAVFCLKKKKKKKQPDNRENKKILSNNFKEYISSTSK